MTQTAPIPTEAQEQTALFQWATMQTGKYPELALMYHIPNVGTASAVRGKIMKSQGLKSGVPDICLPVPRGGCHGLYIEMKRRKGGVISIDQKHWMNALKDQGYSVAVCKGWEVAVEFIKKYLDTEEK